MADQDYSYASVIVPLLTFLRAHPETFFTIEELCQQLDCTSPRVRTALNVLMYAGLVQKDHFVDGNDRYRWGRA